MAHALVGVLDADLRAGDDLLFRLLGFNLCDLQKQLYFNLDRSQMLTSA